MQNNPEALVVIKSIELPSGKSGRSSTQGFVFEKKIFIASLITVTLQPSTMFFEFAVFFPKRKKNPTLKNRIFSMCNVSFNLERKLSM